MPLLRDNDPRQPANRATLIHEAALKVLGPNAEIPSPVWNKTLVQVFKLTRRQAHKITEIASDLDFIRTDLTDRSSRKAVTVLPKQTL